MLWYLQPSASESPGPSAFVSPGADQPIQVDPCHLYNKPAVDCILSDWSEWGECDAARTGCTWNGEPRMIL